MKIEMTTLRLFVALLIAAALGLQSAHAATIQVTSSNDSGPGSLRQALIAANDGDTVQFANYRQGMEVVLTSGELLVNKSVTITPLNEGLQVTVRRSTAGGTPDFRIFHIAPGKTVSISSLSIINGRGGSEGGGGILNSQATLTISNCIVSDNSASFGGGIYCDTHASLGSNTTLTINNSIVRNNSASALGGGIGNGDPVARGNSTVTINNSTVSSNSAGYRGGGIHTDSSVVFMDHTAMLTINNCTISFNTAFKGGTFSPTGGGIHYSAPFPSTMVISNSTLSGNRAVRSPDAGSGGGIAIGKFVVINPPTVTIKNSTISGNLAFRGGGIAKLDSSTPSIGNTILKTDAFSGANIIGAPFTSVGYNLSNDNGNGVLTGPGDQINTDPMLGPCQYNGGPTDTHELLPGSPAIDMGDPGFSPPPDYDQRGPGYPRVVNDRLDIGAIEVQAPPPRPTPTPRPEPTRSP